MNENQKDCILKLQELIMEMNDVVREHDLQSDFLSVIAVGFVDMDTAYVDED